MPRCSLVRVAAPTRTTGITRPLFVSCVSLLCGAEVLIAAPSADQTWTISNDHLAVSVSARDAGAVCSLVHEGKELVNDHDRGRQMQVAWAYNDLDEAYNPTEAGAGTDGVGPQTTSKLVAVTVEGPHLSTTSHPAFWRHMSVPEEHRKNTALFSNDTLTKHVTLGFGGDLHVICYDSTVTVSPHLTGPRPELVRIEAPTLYCDAALDRHYVFNMENATLASVVPPTTRKDELNTVIDRLQRHDTIPILATDDGRHAVAVYTPSRDDFWGAMTWIVPSDDPTNACGKMTAFFRHPVAVAKTYSYRTFIIVGDVATVQASALRLRNDENDK